MVGCSSRVLVTGAGGFIGSHLTEELVRLGYTVRAFVHYNCENSWGWLDTLPEEVMRSVEVIAADIADPYVVRKAVRGCECVFHLAALIGIPFSYVAPASYVETNIKGTLHVLQACWDEDVRRLVHTSTSEVYGTAQYVPIDEKHPLVGQSPYSASKIAADKLAEAYFLSFNLPVATIRPFNTFGPRQSARAVIATLIMQALSGVEPLHVGSLSPVRDFSYVKDTVRGFVAVGASDQAVGRVTNIGSGEGISIGRLVELVLELCDSRARIEVDNNRVRPAASEIRKLTCNSAQAREILEWEPRYSLRQGLEATISWMKENRHRYKCNIYNV